MIRNDPTTQYPEPNDDEEWPLGMRHWVLPFILFLMYIKIANCLSTSYDTTSLRKENQQMKQVIGCKFDDGGLLQIAKESVKQQLPSEPENLVLSREELLDIHAYILFSRLQKLQEPRRDIWAKLSGQFRQDLSKIIYSVCYASTQLEDLAREAKMFNKPTLRQLQMVSVATYVLFRESRRDAQKLNELVDQLGNQLSLVETTMNRANGLFPDIFAKKPGVTTLWKYWMTKGAMTEEELDSYEAKRMMIGRSVINKLDGEFVLPEPVSC
ncbi:uncharacterized protein FFUJ_10511 [Fusarium fujikuroi IMI 58289]|uniref:Uncharacterized protein n=1 Tax=Gibberella fujikuroi (strain CBS 195.34 / IMI 58289 / NRRL A-6831) TaxID=1279085 RepID=S0ENY0_GIBF5|nr:uncharacterized protein FFUJ_10511 [Fusarium fujikuroi IMI 58289]CCT74458.1 uncharacterized protein FFUJ_10511 [Fusarium fujikuroi IMI 58289]SCO05973.1 uncharacterized protein FFM5_08753 [Fusarium fujikuroi]SCO58225.1 uncharacterized protein FFMR_15381 [Fusarium fujikuroi]